MASINLVLFFFDFAWQQSISLKFIQSACCQGYGEDLLNSSSVLLPASCMCHVKQPFLAACQHPDPLTPYRTYLWSSLLLKVQLFLMTADGWSLFKCFDKSSTWSCTSEPVVPWCENKFHTPWAASRCHLFVSQEVSFMCWQQISFQSNKNRRVPYSYN